jgi:hypothetical protein
MTNNFTQETRALNVFDNYCRKCKSNNNCSLHHIYSTISSSAINSIWLCEECHKEADGFNRITGMKGTDRRRELLKLQLTFLVEQDYRFKDVDKEFLIVIDTDIMKILYGDTKTEEGT